MRRHQALTCAPDLTSGAFSCPPPAIFQPYLRVGPLQTTLPASGIQCRLVGPVDHRRPRLDAVTWLARAERTRPTPTFVPKPEPARQPVEKPRGLLHARHTQNLLCGDTFLPPSSVTEDARTKKRAFRLPARLRPTCRHFSGIASRQSAVAPHTQALNQLLLRLAALRTKHQAVTWRRPLLRWPGLRCSTAE